MKIAIITFSDFNTNYGSMLQAFSLGRYLTNLGHEVTFIRYREYNNDLNSNVSIKEKSIQLIKKELLSLYAFFKRKDLKLVNENFVFFKEQYFKYTPLYSSEYELKTKLEEFDCYICGSDQIWNLDCLGGLRTPYFLSFAPNNKLKIAYAASLGDYHISEDLKLKVSELLKKIDFISVREKDSISEIMSLANKPVTAVVDPVFLTTREQWESYLGDRLVKGEYGVCYFVRRSKLGKNIVKKLNSLYDCPIFNLSDNMIYLPGTSSKYITCGPLEFLNLIKYAKFCIGTSFHLAAFSIIFNTPIISIGMNSNKARILNILKIAGIENHLISNKSDLEKNIDNFMSEPGNVDALENEIKNSKYFLEKSLKGIDNDMRDKPIIH